MKPLDVIVSVQCTLVNTLCILKGDSVGGFSSAALCDTVAGCPMQQITVVWCYRTVVWYYETIVDAHREVCQPAASHSFSSAPTLQLHHPAPPVHPFAAFVIARTPPHQTYQDQDSRKSLLEPPIKSIKTRSPENRTFRPRPPSGFTSKPIQHYHHWPPRTRDCMLNELIEVDAGAR